MKRLFWIWVFVGTAVIGCTAGAGSHGESIVGRLEHDAAHSGPVDLDIAALLVEINRVEVAADGVESFHAAARVGEIGQYPCTTCHMAGQGTADTPGEPHWQVTLNHAGPEVMSCTTCHQSDNFDALQSLGGVEISFDHSYQLCAQCHSGQYDDWVGGAHGKRLEGWAPPRVVENCTGCHDPHAPAFESRWPAVIGEGSQE